MKKTAYHWEHSINSDRGSWVYKGLTVCLQRVYAKELVGLALPPVQNPGHTVFVLQPIPHMHK